MFIPKREQGENISPDELVYNKPLAVGVSLLIGSFGGMVGAPGAFILHSGDDISPEYPDENRDWEHPGYRITWSNHRHYREDGRPVR